MIQNFFLKNVTLSFYDTIVIYGRINPLKKLYDLKSSGAGLFNILHNQNKRRFFNENTQQNYHFSHGIISRINCSSCSSNQRCRI